MNTDLTLNEIIKDKLNCEQLREFNRIYYGREDNCVLKLSENTLNKSKLYDFEVGAYVFDADIEQIRRPRVVKIGLIQHSIVLPTHKPIKDQKEAIFNKIKRIIEVAASEGVQILCLQETWSMPFFLCTGEKKRWSEFAESPLNGESIIFLCNLAEKYDMVIVSPILEVDNENVWWNTAVVINEKGKVIGKHRKNHLPSVGSYKETGYYNPGDTGHPVFDTKYGKIAVNICYGRHHALNWMMYGINGAEIVFNPAATISQFGESFWGIEARNAAIANNYYTCSINRVGTEVFNVESKEIPITRSYYGSSYITAPNGCRTPSLSKNKDGLLICQVDLNLCRQVKDTWGFNMTSRIGLYAESLKS